ncbi:MAG TPA: ABC transporter ATP-binding protein [Candidatus Saccharimonadales bacterium]|nr:ABC transporter ATP-binding protein [Candidatus Saccharimonadales bacterium]
MIRDVYQYLLHTYGRHPGQWIGFGLVLASSLINRVVIVLIMARIITAIAGHDFVSAKHYTLYFLVAYLFGVVLWTVGELISIRSEDNEYERLMLAYHAKLIGKDMAFYRNNQTGYLSTVYRQYLDSGIHMLRFVRGEALGTFISLVVPVFVLLFLNWQVGLVTLAVVIIQFIYVVWSSAKANQYRRMTHEVYRKVSGEVSDEITNIVAFKSGGVENRAFGIMRALAHQETEAFWLRRKVTTMLDVPRGVLTAIGMAAAVLIIIGFADNNVQALGLVVLTITYMFQILRSVSTLPDLVHDHDDIITKFAPTLAYLQGDHETIKDPQNPAPLTIKKGAIDITDVTFTYEANDTARKHVPVFTNLTMHIAGGEQVGIVGLSGAGKSTLANLLMRFDDITGGSITIDGIDIRNVMQSELRQNIAYVPQEPLLFHRSIRENIAYYNDTTSEADIIRAAKAAHAHEFIQKLPEGYDSLVGERGIKLSGGQKQRIAIARAILKKGRIMIFDEATSALDSESEQIIQRALPEILGKQTAVVIAHRLSTVAGLDRIIVMHDGRVTEMGTHAQLLKKRGRYYALWQKQTAGSDER